MSLEIERKFLLNEAGEKWVKAWMPKTEGYGKYKGSLLIEQGYLHMSEENTTRVRWQTPMNMSDRITDGFVTRKAKTERVDAAKEEEIRIPPDAALILLDICEYKIKKHRVHYEFHGRLWEIDLFVEANQGLHVAEIEFKSFEQCDMFDNEPRPPWLGEEVTADSRYKNVNLAKHPYLNW